MLKNPINTFLASGSTQLCTGSDVGRSNAAFGRVSQPNETPQAEDIRLCYKYSLRRCRSQHRPIRLQAGTTLVVTYLRASSHPSRENSHPSRENALYTHTHTVKQQCFRQSTYKALDSSGIQKILFSLIF